MYGQNELMNCDLIPDGKVHLPRDYTEYDISTILTIYPIDSVIILVLGTIGALSSLFVIYTFIKYSGSRQFFWDVVFAISISEFVLIMHWMSMVIYNLANGMGPEQEKAFCQGECVVSILGGTAEFTYNCFLCIQLVLLFKDSQREIQIPRKILHPICWVIMVSVLTFCLATQSTGLSLFGMCSFKQKRGFAVYGILIVFMYIFIAVIALYLLYRYTSSTSNVQQSSQYIRKYYQTYIIIQTLIWSVLAASNLIVQFNCTTFQIAGLNVFVTIGNTSKLATPVVLSFVRYKDPIIKRRIRPVFEKFMPCFFKKQNPNEIERSSLQLPEVNSSSLREELLLQSQQDTSGDLNSYKKQNRINSIYTMLAGIILDSKRTSDDPNQLNFDQISEIHCEKSQTRKIIVQEDQVNKIKCMNINSKKLAQVDSNTEVTAYAPEFFHALRKIDKVMVDLEESLDINQNILEIRKKFDGDGGKSGSFFQLTKDRKLILKELTCEELQVVLKNLYKFYKHFKNNPNSLISKIYGMYTFTDQGRDIHIFIQRNAQNSPNKFKIRGYDLKGSTVSRQVLNSKMSEKVKEKEASSRILKDLDFKELERNRIEIESTVAQKMSDIIIEDCKFFNSIQVMDYSLLVLKINWDDYCQEKNMNKFDLVDQLFNNRLYSIPSSTEPSIHYHILIIDYLQEWTAIKQSEQLIKKGKNFDPNLDVSAQPPKEYSQRFMQKIGRQIFVPKGSFVSSASGSGVSGDKEVVKEENNE